MGAGGDLEDRGKAGLSPAVSEPRLTGGGVGCYGVCEGDEEVGGRRPCGGGAGSDARGEGLSAGRAVEDRVEDGVVVHGASLGREIILCIVQYGEILPNTSSSASDGRSPHTLNKTQLETHRTPFDPWARTYAYRNGIAVFRSRLSPP